jgi:hypothetical protein
MLAPALTRVLAVVEPIRKRLSLRRAVNLRPALGWEQRKQRYRSRTSSTSYHLDLACDRDDELVADYEFGSTIFDIEHQGFDLHGRTSMPRSPTPAFRASAAAKSRSDFKTGCKTDKEAKVESSRSITPFFV